MKQHDKKIKLVITDLDNTLFDWFEFWYHSFNAMLEKIEEISDIDREELIPEIKKIHEKAGTAEYSFLIQNIDILKIKYPDENLVQIFDEAIEIYKQKRKEYLKLYPSVYESLILLKERGCTIVAYTESLEFYAENRLIKLNLDGIVDFLYSPPDHEVPTDIESLRKYESEHYKLKKTKTRKLDAGHKKPDSYILDEIIEEVTCQGIGKDEIIYIGDSLTKDIKMAQEANIIDVFAKYGVAHELGEYELLQSVTHWTKEEVEQEQEQDSTSIIPTYTLSSSFSEIFKHFSFGTNNDNIESNIENNIKIWEKTIDVQVHFNDISMKVRNMYMAIIGASIGITAFLLKSSTTNRHEDIFFLLTLLLIFITIAFWFMDRFWYHRLLKGAVYHAIKLENNLRKELPEVTLTNSIGEASPVNSFLGKYHKKFKILKDIPFLKILSKPKWHSDDKIDIFYFIIILALIFSIIFQKI